MTMNPLPPQAYTKETLQKAYTWLLAQPSSIKELATNQDMLISLYLKAQRNGDASLEAPSIQNFKQELKSLANMMGDFGTPNGAASTLATHNNSTMGHSSLGHSSSGSNHVVASTIAQIGLTGSLDNLSMNAIQDVKTTLNLSSDNEALRALIALGHKQFKKINS